MVVLRPGRKVTSSRSQISRMLMMQTGSATKNQIPQPGCGCMFCSAMRFCGEAMGDAAPPMFDAKAIPSNKDFDMSLSAGRFRRMGYDIVSLAKTER